ncbi:MAG TPA: helicase-related protein [Lactobacillaceae bacterium]|jgi:competence protein ComFA
MEAELLYGRMVVTPKIEGELAADKRPPFVDGRCVRCGQRDLEPLPNAEFYCRACLQLGRVSSLDWVWSLPEPHAFLPLPPHWQMKWHGQLTPAQTRVSKELLDTWRTREKRLVWAVTGAGKTEMLFPMLAEALRSGTRVAVVSPRIDVINELAPRLQMAFAGVDMVVLHGRTDDVYRYTPFVLATVHQLLRFYQAFDLIVVDEVDSLPLAGDPMLARAIANAQLPRAAVVYLTATPTRALQTAVQRGVLPVSYLPRRFHGAPLPEIRVRRVDWRARLQQGRLPGVMKRQLLDFEQRQQRFLIFVPQVADLPVVQAVLQRCFPALKGEAVHARDEQRQEKVQLMREGKVDYLVTTTILERGVTLPGIDVLIFGADEVVFSAQALIQIAGRVGRSAERPTGLVMAYVTHVTLNVRRAQREIRWLNAKKVAE